MSSMNRQKRIIRTAYAGFTLIELLAAISILAMLASISISAAQTGRMRAREAERKDNLKRLQVYLELYRSDYNSYPSTGGNPNNPNWYGSEPNVPGLNYNGGNWIPNLAPGYIRVLPRDPLGKLVNPPVPGCGVDTVATYAYRSNGLDYKLISGCSQEIPMVSSDPFWDERYRGYSFTVCTPGGCGW